MQTMARIEVLGAGITGLWQALMLAGRGHNVSLLDPAGVPSVRAASRLAGAMLAPYCESEPGHELAGRLGIEALRLWKARYPELSANGSLVVAAPRDQADLERFALVTKGYRRPSPAEIHSLEPSLEGRFRETLYYENEAHVEPLACMEFLASEARKLGALFGDAGESSGNADWIVDCRGISARDGLKTLRGVRGERLIIHCPEVQLNRPIRLLHPRVPFYIVPWSEGRFMIGATVIESEDEGPPTVRSVAELLSLAYTLLPQLGEARIVDLAAGLRPSFPDNEPKIIVRGRRLFVNGMYRNGFLLAPIFAEAAADYIESAKLRDGVVFEDHGEW